MSSSCDAAAAVQWAELPTSVSKADALRAAIEEGRRAGYDEGFRAGVEAGLAETAALRRSLEADGHALLASVADAARSLQAVRVQAASEIEDALAGAALDLAEAVLGRALAAAESPGRDALARALALAPAGSEVVVRMHPADADLLGPVPDGVTVVADAGVERGGCVAEAGDWRVDAQLSTALARARASLSGGHDFRNPEPMSSRVAGEGGA